MKKIFIIFGIILFVSAAGFFAYRYYYKNNSDFRDWTELPEDVKSRSIMLEIERPFLHFFGGRIDSAHFKHIDCDQLYQSIVEGANWLILMQEESGRYNYWLDPLTGKVSHKGEDNLPRQIGTAYSMLIAYEKTHNPIYLTSAKMNIDYFLNFSKDVEPDLSYLIFRKKAKLGSIGLAVIAMLKYQELTNSDEYDEKILRLGNMILHLQNVYGTGQFKSTYIYRGDYKYEKSSGWESNIYPGEAMLALVRLYFAYKDEEYLSSLILAREYYSQGFRWQVSSFWPWTTSAMAEAYILTGDDEFKKFAYKMADRTCFRQNINNRREVVGSFGPLPNVFSSPSLEGLSDAIKLAQFAGDEKREEKYTKALRAGFAWLLPLQFSQQEIDDRHLPIKALGGFRRSYYDEKIRIDNTQHSISAFAKSIGVVYH